MCFNQIAQAPAAVAQIGQGALGFSLAGPVGAAASTSSGDLNPLGNIANNTMSVIGDLNGSTAETAQAQKALDEATANQNALIAAQEAKDESNEVLASNAAAASRTSNPFAGLGFNPGPNVNLLANVSGSASPAQDFMGR